MNMVSNSCRIGLKRVWYFFKILHDKDVLHMNLCKRVWFWGIKCRAYFCRVVLPCFVMVMVFFFFFFFFCNFVFEDPLNCICLGVKLLHLYLFRVEKNACLGCQIPLLYLFRGTNFSLGNTCLGCCLWVDGWAWYPFVSFEWCIVEFFFKCINNDR